MRVEAATVRLCTEHLFLRLRQGYGGGRVRYQAGEREARPFAQPGFAEATAGKPG
jgi:hypothetical protein